MLSITLWLLFWIILAPIVASVVPSLVHINEEEEAFVAKYGNDSLKSGYWAPMRRVVSDGNTATITDVLSLIHRKSNYNLLPASSNVISKFLFGTGILTFQNLDYKPIIIDLIAYTTGASPGSYNYVTKGTTNNSFYYLIKKDSQGTEFQLGRLIINVSLPFAYRLKYAFVE